MTAGGNHAAQQSGRNAESRIAAGHRCGGKQRTGRNAYEGVNGVPQRIEAGILSAKNSTTNKNPDTVITVGCASTRRLSGRR